MPSTAARARGRGGARGRAATAQHMHSPPVVDNPSFGGAEPYAEPGNDAEQYGASSSTTYSTPVEGEHQGTGIAETSADESKSQQSINAPYFI